MKHAIQKVSLEFINNCIVMDILTEQKVKEMLKEISLRNLAEICLDNNFELSEFVDATDELYIEIIKILKQNKKTYMGLSSKFLSTIKINSFRVAKAFLSIDFKFAKNFKIKSKELKEKVCDEITNFFLESVMKRPWDVCLEFKLVNRLKNKKEKVFLLAFISFVNLIILQQKKFTCEDDFVKFYEEVSNFANTTCAGNKQVKHVKTLILQTMDAYQIFAAQDTFERLKSYIDQVETSVLKELKNV